jgi:RHS repeat-associated protein
MTAIWVGRIGECDDDEKRGCARGAAMKSTRWWVTGLLHALVGASLPFVTMSAGASEEATVTAQGESRTMLPDGRWLVLGGLSEVGASAGGVVSDPRTGSTAPLPRPMAQPRAGHTATVLPNGMVLIFGGEDGTGRLVETAELFDPGTLGISPLPAFEIEPRAWHTATLLTDGAVAIVGGLGRGGTIAMSIERWSSFTELLEPGGLELRHGRVAATSELLADGTVLLRGGVDARGRPVEIDETVDFDRGLVSEVPRAGASVTRDGGGVFTVFTQPANGASEVPVDSVLVGRFSRIADVASLTPDRVELADGDGATVAVRVVAAEGGRLVFVTPEAFLSAGTQFFFSIGGVLDLEGRPVRRTTVVFRTAGPREGDREGRAGEVSRGGAGQPLHGRTPVVLEPPVVTPGTPGEVDELEWRGARRNGKPHSAWQDLPPLRAATGVTALAGQVLKLDGNPLPGVALQVDDRVAYSDDTGRFLLTGVPEGYQRLVMMGFTANSGDRHYGVFEHGVDIEPGQTTRLPFTIWMPLIDTQNAVALPQGRTSRVVVARTPRIPGMELHVPAGLELRTPSGGVLESLTLTPVPLDRTPFPLPEGTRLFVVPQGHGTSVVAADGMLALAGKGVRAVFPNVPGGRPGERFELRSYEPYAFGWYSWGEGRVSGDGLRITSRRQDTLSEIGCGLVIGPAETTAPPNVNGPTIMDPVDPSTGQFVYEKTDLFVPDVIPIALRRSYSSGWTANRAFGKGTLHNFDFHLTGDGQAYMWAELITLSGARVRYTRVAPPPPGGGSLADAQFWHTGPATAFYKSILSYGSWPVIGQGWRILFKDGMAWYLKQSGLQAPRLARIVDRMGNEVVVTRPLDGPHRITSPNGRWIELDLDGTGRVSQARDHAGRAVTYTYDANGRLSTVRDPALGVTEYGYDAADRVTTIRDARGIVYVSNEYDAEGRVWRQTQAEGVTWTASYSPAGGTIAQADVTDPRGFQRRLMFNALGQVVTETDALGRPEARTTTREWQPETNLLTAFVDTVDGVARRTEYTYDALGNLVGLKQLAGTANAVATSWLYGVFGQVASVTDPLGRTTTFGLDTNGNATTIVRPLNRVDVLTYNSAGQMTSIARQGRAPMRFVYDRGLLVQTIDGLNRTSTRFLDASGRPTMLIDSEGSQTGYEYDPLDRVSRITDALGGQTGLSYDANGNLVTVTDARGSTTDYTYDQMDRVVTRRDPLGRQDTYRYDPNGNLIQVTDRRGTVTEFAHDGLNRRTFAGFGKTGPATYESTIGYGYDAGNRLRTVTDSLNGTITLSYDGVDRLTQEVSPQGTVSYTYDAAGRRSTMTVLGQPQTTYAWDAADRLLELVKSQSTVRFTYDIADQRTSLTLPNGVAVDHAWDQSSQLTGLTYRKGSATLGTLTYGYDAVGRRWQVGGTWARTGLPDPLTAATYNAANHQLALGPRTMTYDPTGNLATLTEPGGTTAFTWDARGQLVGMAMPHGGASFQYDGLGRRRARTVLGVQTGFFYDGLNQIQELSAGTVTGNVLTGLGLDESFSRTTSAGTRTLLTDALGSTVALTDNAGGVQTEYTYEPFGATIEMTGDDNSLQHAGRENDLTGLYYYRARYYHPKLQRFVSEDPIEFPAGELNLYAFVSGDPVDWIDPFGLDKLEPCLGAKLGESAAFWWATRQAETGSVLYWPGGVLASMWRPESCQITASILLGGYPPARYFGRPYWQYFPRGDAAYRSGWMTRGWGWKPPYTPGPEAASRLSLPPRNPGTAVRPLMPRWWEPVIGPRSARRAYNQLGGGAEYFQGWRWPQ